MRDKEIMTLEKALFILRHGSAEGEHKYFEAITIIENEINRQKAEIERLKGMVSQNEGVLPRYEQLIKVEAYKEFAEKAVEKVEKARQKYQRLCKEQGEEMEEHMHIHFNGIIGIINNLVKEAVGDNNE